MQRDDKGVPLEACTLPGTVKVTDRALRLAERFQASVPSGWAVAFLWCEGRGMRANKDAPLQDQGPGLDLGAYRIGQIPEEAFYQAGSLSYAVLISKDVVDSHPERTIDLDESDQLVLR